MKEDLTAAANSDYWFKDRLKKAAINAGLNPNSPIFRDDCITEEAIWALVHWSLGRASTVVKNRDRKRADISKDILQASEKCVAGGRGIQGRGRHILFALVGADGEVLDTGVFGKMYRQAKEKDDGVVIVAPLINKKGTPMKSQTRDGGPIPTNQELLDWDSKYPDPKDLRKAVKDLCSGVRGEPILLRELVNIFALRDPQDGRLVPFIEDWDVSPDESEITTPEV